MMKILRLLRNGVHEIWNKLNIRIDMREKLILIFLGAKVIPLIFVTVLALSQMRKLGILLGEIAVTDSTAALNYSATESIERLSTDTANRVARFLYDRDNDLRYLASLEPTQENYERFIQNRTADLVKLGRWELAEDGKSWESAEEPPVLLGGGVSTNKENEDENKFHYRPHDQIHYEPIPLYDEITFVDLRGMEQVKVVRPSPRKAHYPLDPARKDVSLKENTYVKAETYFDAVKTMKPGEIYVSDVMGAYVGANYIGMYVPEAVGLRRSRGVITPPSSRRPRHTRAKRTQTASASRASFAGPPPWRTGAAQ